MLEVSGSPLGSLQQRDGDMIDGKESRSKESESKNKLYYYSLELKSPITI
jgi:hypothetical protein